MSLPQSPRILAFAYACVPGRGSEPGAGWAWARMLAQLGETWVITRNDYRESIERELRSMPERDRLTFIYVDLPDKVRSWQRGDRGLRSYYLLWQIASLREARRLRRSLRFDVVWHLTWANAWYGSVAALAGRPFVYGPVGGCVNPAWRLLPQLGWGGAAYEVGRVIGRSTARYLNPLARVSWNRADLILAQNAETRDWLPRRHRGKTRLFPNAVINEEMTPRPRRPDPVRPTARGVRRQVGAVERRLPLLHVWPCSPIGDWSSAGPAGTSCGCAVSRSRLGVDDRVEWLAGSRTSTF